MKKIFAILAVVISTSVTLSAQTLANGQVEAQNVNIQKISGTVSVNFDLDLSDLSLSANRGLVLTPIIAGISDTLRLPAIEILGRLRHLYWQRNGATATQNPVIVARRHNGDLQVEHYAYKVPYQPWMKGSRLVIEQADCKCAQRLGTEALAVTSDELEPEVENTPVEEPVVWEFAYIKPQPEAVKQRAEEGTARLNFEVNKYDIRSDFGNNAAELKKIRETIDLVKNDSDVSLTGIYLHGYASPDGPYAHNAELAKNRTSALEKYLENYYGELNNSLFTMDSTPEDWKGFREFADTCGFSGRWDVLNIIDSDMTPDEKDWTLMMRYTTFYKNVVLPVAYPSLRRTDYKVTYDVRNFSLEEARRIIRERPQKLSLNEMYLVANSYEEGSDDFNRVFDIAVRMFPESEIANVNAACVALENGNMKDAAMFLANAGDSPEAKNARGIFAAMNGDKEAALELFSQASSLEAARNNYRKIN